jgi:hypothetical protein
MPPVDAAPAKGEPAKDEQHTTAKGSGETSTEGKPSQKDTAADAEKKDETATATATADDAESSWLDSAIGTAVNTAKSACAWASDICAAWGEDATGATAKTNLKENPVKAATTEESMAYFGTVADWDPTSYAWMTKQGFPAVDLTANGEDRPPGDKPVGDAPGALAQSSDAKKLEYDIEFSGWVNRAIDNVGNHGQTPHWDGTDSQGRRISTDIRPGEVIHTGPNGEVTTVDDKWIVITRPDSPTYRKDKTTGLESEVGDNWRAEESADGKRTFTREDGAKMEVDDNGRNATITRADGTSFRIRLGHQMREIIDGRQVYQNKGNQEKLTAEERKEKREDEERADVAAGVNHEGEEGVNRVNAPDGTTIFAHRDGRKVFKLTDGTTVRVQPDGSYRVVRNGVPVNSDLVKENDGQLTIGGANGRPAVTVQLTGAGAGVVRTENSAGQGVTIQGQGNDVALTTQTGDVTNVQTGASGASTVTEGRCTVGQDSTACVNPGGTADTDKINETLETRANPEDGTMSQGVPGEKPEVATDPDNPLGYFWDVGGDIAKWGVDAANNMLSYFTTPSETSFLGDVWKGITNVWDGAGKVVGNTLDFRDGTFIDGLGNVFADNDFIGSGNFATGDNSPAATQAAGIVASASAVASRVSGLTPDSITPGDIGALLAAYADLAGLKGSLIAEGALSSLSAVEQALGNVAGQIPEAVVATDLQAKARATTAGVTDDVINKLFKGAHGTDWSSINKVLNDSGLNEKRIDSALEDIGTRTGFVVPADALAAMGNMRNGQNEAEVIATLNKYNVPNPEKYINMFGGHEEIQPKQKAA